MNSKYILPIALVLLALVGRYSNSIRNIFKNQDINVPAVKEVDLNRYAGKWYELYRIDYFFERGLSSCTATYNLKDGYVEVINRGYNKSSNSWKEAKAKAYPQNKGNSKLKIYFFLFFGAKYWVSMLDKNYKWAVVSNPSGNLFWILSRTKKLDQKIIDNIFVEAKKWGINTNNVLKVKQE